MVGSVLNPAPDASSDPRWSRQPRLPSTPVTYSLVTYSRLMVRVSGLDVTEGHDEPHSTKPDDRQSGLAGIQLLSFHQLQLCGEEGDPHSLRGPHLPLDCETHQTVPHHLRIAQQQAPAVP